MGYDFGGTIRFTFDGQPLTIRAKVDIEPGDNSYSGEHNQDGSFDRYVQPMGPSAELEFVDGAGTGAATSPPWNAIMLGGPYNVAILEDNTGIIHQFANAKFIGRTKIDRLKGSVTGMTIQAPVGGYTQLTS